MAVIFTRAHIPRGLENAWLQHLRDFDTKHAGCHFEVMVDPRPDISLHKAVEMCVVTPELTFSQIFMKKPPA